MPDDHWPGLRSNPRGFSPSQADDLPHAFASTEWWYVHGHAVNERDEKGGQGLPSGGNGVVSIFACFFRTAVGVDEATGEVLRAYAVNWAVSDGRNEGYYQVSLVDEEASGVILGQ
eukprot:1340874-Amorphochlora_amoeboformis.AAC.1